MLVDELQPSRLPHLNWLSINGINLGVKGAKVLSELPSLRTLKISDNPIGDEGLGYLTKLNQL